MAHGDGSVRKYETEDGPRWAVTVSFKDRHGKYRQKKLSGFRTEAEARRAGRQVRREKEKGEFLTPSRRTVEQYVQEEYLPHVAKKGRAAITQANYRAALERWVIPQVGAIPVQKLRWQDVQAMIDSMDGLSPATVSLCVTLLKACLDLAVADDVIPVNPAASPRLIRRSGTASSRVPWSVEEARQFIASLEPDKDDMDLAFLLMLLTGIRRAEVAGLRWGDIDLDAGAILIARSVSSVDGVLHVSEGGKTENSRRVVALVPRLVELLTRHKMREVERFWANGKTFGGDAPVFATWYCTPRSPHTFSTRFQSAVKRAKVRPIPLHALRHLFVTQAQFDPQVSQTMLGKVVGHGSAQVTAGYTHADVESALRVVGPVAERLIG